MGHPLIDKSLADVAECRGFRCGRAGQFRFFFLPFFAVGQQVIGITGPHDAGSCQGQGNPGCIDGDPAAAPLFGNIGGGAGTAGGVEDEVSGVGGHKYTPLEWFN